MVSLIRWRVNQLCKFRLSYSILDWYFKEITETFCSTFSVTSVRSNFGVNLPLLMHLIANVSWISGWRVWRVVPLHPRPVARERTDRRVVLTTALGGTALNANLTPPTPRPAHTPHHWRKATTIPAKEKRKESRSDLIFFSRELVMTSMSRSLLPVVGKR
jgi:hypothetical protein